MKICASSSALSTTTIFCAPLACDQCQCTCSGGADMGSNGDDNLNMCTYPPRESVGLSDKSPIYAVAPGDVVSRMMVETHCMSIPTNMPTYSLLCRCRRCKNTTLTGESVARPPYRFLARVLMTSPYPSPPLVPVCRGVGQLSSISIGSVRVHSLRALKPVLPETFPGTPCMLVAD